MDWSTLSPLLASIAPFAGKLLGGLLPFPGASLIGEQFGNIIAKQFGVAETPAAVAAAIAGSPNEVVIAKINQAIEIARIEIAGFADIEKAYVHAVEVGLGQVGETMRQETAGRVQLALQGKQEHWFFTGWRPAAGWTFVYQANVFGCILMIAGIRSAFFESPQSLDRLVAAWPIYLAYFASLAAMVGVYIIGRSMDKGKAFEVGTTATPAKSVTAVPPKATPPSVRPRQPGFIPG